MSEESGNESYSIIHCLLFLLFNHSTIQISCCPSGEVVAFVQK